MAQAAATFPAVVGREAAVPWYVWGAVLATTSSMIGVQWDISWHRTIGRDTFWTPAHIAIYLCGVLAGLSSGYLILATTFARGAAHLRDASVQLWGFRGPLGAFLAAWGGIAMLTSAPFDDWWHGAYGLDVKIISPPHMVLALGMFAVQFGALLLVLARMNRAEGEQQQRLRWVFLFVSGLVIVNMSTLILEYTPRTLMHAGVFYRSVALAIPVFLVAMARAAGTRWAAVKITLVYTVFWQLTNLVLQAFPAEPKLGPVYNPVTHFVPSFFPSLLVVGAVGVDWVIERRAHWSTARRGLAAGTAFLALFTVAQWPFADFLMSPLARNWFIYAHLTGYNVGPGSYTARNLYFPYERTAAEFWLNMGLALAASLALSWVGMHWGAWMRRVRR